MEVKCTIQDAVTRHLQQWSIVRQVAFSLERIIDGGMRSAPPSGMPHALMATYVSQRTQNPHTWPLKKGLLKYLLHCHGYKT